MLSGEHSIQPHNEPLLLPGSAEPLAVVDSKSDPVPEAVPDQVPEAMPDQAPEAVPDQVPEAVPDAVPVTVVGVGVDAGVGTGATQTAMSSQAGHGPIPLTSMTLSM